MPQPQTPCRITGTCGLDGGIKRQKVGLPGDIADQANDLPDLERGIIQPLNVSLVWRARSVADCAMFDVSLT
nr:MULTISPECIES: hypothetical protein [Thalassospira]